MNGKTISVIVPVYNTGRYLRACLDSIMQQSYNNLEVWMVDDGSTDDSGKICDEYEMSDNRFHAIHQKNAGVSVARNTGIRMATGDYISFIDSDDWIEPEFYEILVGLFDQETTMSMCCYCMSNGQPCLPMGKTEEAKLDNEEALCFVITDKMSGPCNKLFLRSRILEKGLLFNQGITVGEDMLFVVEYLTEGSLHFIPRPLYHYRQTEESASRSDFKPSRMTLFTAMDQMEKTIPKEYENVRKTISSKRAYAGYVSLLILKTSEEKPQNGADIEKRLVKIIRGNLKEFLRAPGYTIVEKAASILIAISPKIGTRIYSLTYMKKIKNR